MANDQTMRIKSQIHDQNINKRGKVAKSLTKKEEKFAVGPVLLGVFLFVVVGSAIFQMLNAATQGDI
eukprot:CAMPEP_0176442196 /NCGR_PEP_ID=MMETSP0127-20121128/21666_1 /TAXON_ID=938130 /ORGANISM="Platyophrya macrostoma, Strain WH" /LENGTH=66 /DNA_ID=CAMNT_0017827153 /DNA_START=53 /DNA_END=253 /DNA_ORIENTATION=+